MLKPRLAAIIARPYPGPFHQWQMSRAPQLPQPLSSQATGLPWLSFLPQSLISSSFAHLMPLFLISTLFSISVSGNFPSFLNMILKQRPNTHSAIRIKDASNISI